MREAVLEVGLLMLCALLVAAVWCGVVFFVAWEIAG